MSEFDDAAQPASRVAGCMFQVVTHAIALALGSVGGILGVQFAEYQQNPEIFKRPEGELSRAELIAKLDASQKAYEELLKEQGQKEEQAKTELTAANKKVDDLQGQVTKKEEEVKVLALKAKKSANKSAALTKELEAAQAELEALRVQLDTALAEKAQLEKDLSFSQEETRMARQETDVARGETVDAKWDGFKAEAAVQICEKGNRNKLAQCKTEVSSALSSARATQYKHCLRSGQAEPRLVKADLKRTESFEMPRWGEWFGQNSKFTEDTWYIVFCDPTLPEAQLSSDLPSGLDEEL